MTVWQWRRMKARWRKATLQNASAELDLMELLATSSLTVVAIIGKYYWEPLHGTLLVWPISQHPKTSGVVKTHHLGFSHAATITSWCGTTTRSPLWKRHYSCAGWEFFWTTTTTLCPSMMPWTPSTYTLLTFPSCFRWLPPSWSGTSHWWSCQGCRCLTLWTAASSKRASAANRSHPMFLE